MLEFLEQSKAAGIFGVRPLWEWRKTVAVGISIIHGFSPLPEEEGWMKR